MAPLTDVRVLLLHIFFSLLSLSFFLPSINARLNDLEVKGYQLSDFTVTTVSTNSGDFDLRISHHSQPTNTLFSFSKYYGTKKIPFLFVSNTSLTQEPITHGHQQLFLQNQKFYYFSNDITIDLVTHSSNCVNITGELVFPPRPRRRTGSSKEQLRNLPYLFSICLALDPLYPYYANDTAFYLNSALSLNIDLLPQPSDSSTTDTDATAEELLLQNKQFNRIVFSYDVQSPTESFLGFGTQYSYFNLRGKVLPILVSEQGVGRGLEPITTILNKYWEGVGGYFHTTYGPKAMYLSNRNYSVLFENYDIMIFDVASSDPESITLECFANDTTASLRGKLIFAPEPIKLVQEVTLVTGRMPPLPEWASQGHILGIEGGAHYVLNNTLRLVREHEVPVAAVWLQDWVGLVKIEEGQRLLWNWRLNSEQYPNYQEMKSQLRQEGVRIMSYINPYFADVSEEQGQQGEDVVNYFKQGVEQGYFIKNANNETYLINSLSIQFATVDLTNPAAVRWVKDIIINHMIGDTGVSGFMADFGEYVPFDCVLFDASGLPSDVKSVVVTGDAQIDANEANVVKLTQSTYHNYFAELWARVVRDAIIESGRDDEVIAFHRSQTLHSPKYARAFWLGDQLVTWDQYDGMRSVLYGLFSSNLAGATQMHSDVGGYVILRAVKWVVEYVRSQELMMRWIELSAFTDTLFRSHPGTLPNGTLQLWTDDKVAQHLKYFTDVFVGLAAYKRDVQLEAYYEGSPVVRHLFLDFWNDANVQEAVRVRMDDVRDKEVKERAKVIHEEFMLGDCMLVAPVMHPGKTKRQVYLPKGVWTSYWNEKEVIEVEEGEFREMKAPLGKPPVFVCDEWKSRGYSMAQQVFGSQKYNSGFWTTGVILAVVIGIAAVAVMSQQKGMF